MRFTENLNEVEVVEFVLGDEHYAIDIFNVCEVVETKNITSIPNVPAYIEGVIDLRGNLILIVNLKTKLHLPGEVIKNTSRIIVLDEKATVTNKKFGILVDDVLAVSTFEKNMIDTASLSAFDHNKGIILGIIKNNIKVKNREITNLIILIDIRKLLSE